MRKVLFAAVLLFAGTPPSSAQIFYPEGNNEIAGTFGNTFISNQNVLNLGLANSALTFGTGYSFEVSYARILRSADWADFSVEVPATFNPDEDVNSRANGVPEGYSSIFVTPAARIRFFPYVALSPWVSFGGGFGHFQAGSTLFLGGANSQNRSVNTGVLEGGIGLDVRIPCTSVKRWKIRVEARDDWSGVPPLNVNTGKTRQHNYYVAGGMVYRF
ncbi:MAG TPA: hypothetical protein VJ731_00055 [Terriglobales bacterium]|nr:hypothetical protein [Terriglobales bacterium]